MKVLYLFNGIRKGLLEKVQAGDNPGEGFWGMLRLPHYGITADYIELERTYPKKVAAFLRKHLNIYFIHVPLLWKIFAYDIVFTSTAFGTQFIHTLLSFIGLSHPQWVMHDFSITSLIGARRTVRQKIMYFLTSRAAGIVTISQLEAERLRSMFPHLASRIAYITFGVDLGFFKPSTEAKERVVLGAGFDPDRDWKTLVKACENLDVSVHIETRPERLRELSPVPSCVRQTMSSVRELATFYARSSVFVLPLDTSSGLNDAMGCSTLLEAMASGCAIVATRTPTMESYIIDGENGLLVPEGDVESMREAIARLLSDEAFRDRLGANARAYAEAHLDAEKCAVQLAEFFHHLMLGSNQV